MIKLMRIAKVLFTFCCMALCILNVSICGAYGGTKSVSSLPKNTISQTRVASSSIFTVTESRTYVVSGLPRGASVDIYMSTAFYDGNTHVDGWKVGSLSEGSRINLNSVNTYYLRDPFNFGNQSRTIVFTPQK